MNTTSDLSVNNHLCAIVSPYPIKEIWKYLHVYDWQEQELHSSNFESCKSLGTKTHLFWCPWICIQKNYGPETSEFKIHSFRAFQRYLADI